MAEMLTKLPTSVLKGNSNKISRILKEQIDYIGSDSVYSDREEYMNFIGKEIDENANFGRQVAYMMAQAKGQLQQPLSIVETCSGPGTNSRDIHQVIPNVNVHCLEYAEEMCNFGRDIHPHLNFIECDVTRENSAFLPLMDKVDYAFNSASSLGFFTQAQLLNHFKVMSLLLKDGGSYFADQGYYSSVLAAGLINERIDTVSEYKGEQLFWRTLTTKYFPLTDFHEIAYSGWRINGEEAELVIAVKHQLRAYRASEVAALAEIAGLEFRMHQLFWEWDNDNQHYVFRFEPVTAETFDRYPMQNYVFEFHKGQEVSLSDLTFSGYGADIQK
ncbi:methyltransferase domain-containing protein [Ewingella americana]|uniref:Class I SAM-dependent methyltransferase n=1 Tax=Ewingella americana TaxID=41202 RepID=A0A502GD17_9GAMM|nr:class I SAM-dependent methyltransferase [Ewingella americana]TPG59989.1 class I SAM-dependent methyltransferase [Ewingella americana]